MIPSSSTDLRYLLSFDPYTRRRLSLFPTACVSDPSSDTDVLVVGGGVAGAALSASLGKRGYRVTCIERSLGEPHRIVGELLQPLGVQHLKNMGIEECLEGLEAVPIEGYTILMNRQINKLSYPSIPDNSPSSPLSSTTAARGASFHNGRFVQSLRRIAKEQKTVTLIEGNVLKLNENKVSGRVEGVTYKTKREERDPKDSNKVIEIEEKKEIRAALTVVCDGCLSSFRNKLIVNKQSVKSKFLGLILPMNNTDLPVPSRGHVILANPTPILAYPITHKEIRMLIDVPNHINLPTDKEGIKEYLMLNVYNQLPNELKESFVKAINGDDPFRSMPNQSLPSRPLPRPGTLMLGDIYNMRHPLTGGGMSVAFSDISLITQWISKIHSFDNYELIDELVQSHYSIRSKPVRVINILADALYEIFNEKNDQLRNSCYSYLSMGGIFSAGPVSFLSGTSSNQSFLVFHFFCVALYSFKDLLPFPTPSRIISFIRSIRTAVGIMVPLIVQENNYIPVKILATIVRSIFWI